MLKSHPSLFEGDRLSLFDALEITADSLRAYAKRYRHWAIAFSGGKDSSATATAVAYLIATGAVPAPETLTVLYADTRMELPPLRASAMKILTEFGLRGIHTQVVLPPLDDRFYVYMLGRGVPPPKNRFRWCTPQIKVEPMLNALVDLRDSVGEKILMLTGVRVGESAARDQRIAVSCGKDGAECGQGWFQETTPASIADTLAPCLHWRICHVWDWLTGLEVSHGFSTFSVAESYGGGAAEGDEVERNARTGCVGCNLASRDVALERVVKSPNWSHLAPLFRLRPLYTELTRAHNRLRKIGETKADGSPVANPGRLGPLVMEARLYGLQQVLDIQNDVNIAAAETGRSGIDLLNATEIDRIHELIALNTWPNRWDGDEVRGDEVLPIMPTKGGGMQHTLMAALSQD